MKLFLFTRWLSLNLSSGKVRPRRIFLLGSAIRFLIRALRNPFRL